MTTFLFWNTNARPIGHLIATLAHDYDADVLILAECDIRLVTLLTELNKGHAQKYAITFSPSERILVFTRFPHTSITPILDAGGISIRKIQPPIGVEILMVAVHLSSKLHQDTADQALSATRLARYIREVENNAGHKRTVVVGDFNMNPFEDGFVGAEALHAVMDRTVALKLSRVVEGEERFFFYNPMWGLFGDAAPGPAGTYYRYSSQQINFFWNMFDQVIVRPDLLPRFSEADLKVLTAVGTTSLLTAGGIPDRAIGSDHLPILFRLNLEME